MPIKDPETVVIEKSPGDLASIEKRAWQTAEDHGFHEAQRSLSPMAKEAMYRLLLAHMQVSMLASMFRDSTTDEDFTHIISLIEEIPWSVYDTQPGFPGLSDIEASILLKLLLIHEEVDEAAEAALGYVAGPTGGLDVVFYGDIAEVHYDDEKAGKPEGFLSELADIIIRVVDCSAAVTRDLPAEAPDITSVTVEKQDYNDTRPFLHGRKN